MKAVLRAKLISRRARLTMFCSRSFTYNSLVLSMLAGAVLELSSRFSVFAWDSDLMLCRLIVDGVSLGILMIFELSRSSDCFSREWLGNSFRCSRLE